MSYLKPHVSFSWNFASLFNAMRENYSVLSWLKHNIIFTKGTHQSPKISGKFQLPRLISSNLYFGRLLLLKLDTISAKKKYRGVMLIDTEGWCKIWRKTNLLFQNRQEFGEFWSGYSKLSKICTLIGPFSAQYIIFDIRKYWGAIFHGTEEYCKIWRKTSLQFGTWHEDIGKFSSEHSKTSKMWTLMCCFWPKHSIFELKTYRGVIFDGTEYWCRIWSKTDLCFQKWYKEFGKFFWQILANLDFHWVLLSKVENVWA